MTTGIAAASVPRLVDQFERGLDAPICLTWELTYACNLSCVHCLSSSGRRDPRELTTQECYDLIDEFQRMKVTTSGARRITSSVTVMSTPPRPSPPLLRTVGIPIIY